nr:unnamed protein product [Callosobruchus analis]
MTTNFKSIFSYDAIRLSGKIILEIGEKRKKLGRVELSREITEGEGIERLCAEVKQTYIVTTIKIGRLRLRWAGYNNTVPTKRNFDAIQTGSRSRGKPRVGWRNGLFEDAAKIGAANWKILARHGKEGRTRLEKVEAPYRAVALKMTTMMRCPGRQIGPVPMRSVTHEHVRNVEMVLYLVAALPMAWVQSRWFQQGLFARRASYDQFSIDETLKEHILFYNTENVIKGRFFDWNKMMQYNKLKSLKILLKPVQMWESVFVIFYIFRRWRKIQQLGLASEYKNQQSPIGNWLNHLFGLTFLPPPEVGECFAQDFMSDKPQDSKVDQFTDYLVDLTSTVILNFLQKYGQKTVVASLERQTHVNLFILNLKEKI